MSVPQGLANNRWLMVAVFVAAVWIAPRAIRALGTWAGVPAWLVSGTVILTVVAVLLGLLTVAAQADLSTRQHRRD